MSPTAEQVFTTKVREAVRIARENGYTPGRFEGMLDSHGSIKTAKLLIRSGEIQNGLKQQSKMKRVDLSIESIMLNPEFEALFTADELAAAKWRLSQV